MSSFTDKLVVSPLKKHQWVLERDLTYEIGHKGSGKEIVAPEGFITDFASIPRLLWSIYSPFDTYLQAAVIHDWLYWEQTQTRKRADQIFTEGMKVLGVGIFTRNILFQNVRVFGWMAWNNNAKAKAKGVSKYLK